MKNYISFFEPRKFQVVYVPRDTHGEYSRLYLNVSKQYLRFFNTRNVFASAIAAFVFLKQIFFIVIGILLLFLILSHNKKWAKRLHLLIPVIVYTDMRASEITYFLKRNPQFAKQDNAKTISNSKIVETYADEQSDDIMSKIESETVGKSGDKIYTEEKVESKIQDKIQEKPERSFKELSTKSTSPTPAKSIFDDYESVMDKFGK